jgi:uncharacterized protein YndB with AHSA1/START domain
VSETTSETTTIEQTVRIAASPETVWEFWTDPARLAEWWGHAAEVELEPGGLFRVAMDSGPVMRGSFITLDPPYRLEFTFGWEQNAGGPLAPGSTRVEVTLTPEGNETVLVLRHLDMPITHAADHEKGWGVCVGDRLVAAASRHGR